VVSVTADTNVYISASISPGPPFRVLTMGIDGLIRIDVSDPIVSEVVRVLRTKFEWDGYRLNDIRQRILRMAHHVTPVRALDVVKEDPDDNRILECAIEAGSDFIVTADKHLLRLVEYQGIEIVRAGDFLQRVPRR
jgi:uncharacterized protein